MFLRNPKSALKTLLEMCHKAASKWLLGEFFFGEFMFIFMQQQ